MLKKATVCRFLLCVSLGLPLLQCGGSDSAIQQNSRVCEYDDFSVDVTSGPSLGLHLAGSLLLEETISTGSLSGALRATDGSLIPVSGSVYKNGDIALTFNTRNGYVMGLGALGDKFCKPGAMLEGVAIGPRVSANMITASDSGHWLLQSPNLLFEPTVTLLEPTDPTGEYSITIASGTTTNITCQAGATQVSPSCCSGNVGGGGTSTTCSGGGATCTTTRSNNFASADVCCETATRFAPMCAAGQSQIQP